jgi:hypothetical protein
MVLLNASTGDLVVVTPGSLRPVVVSVSGVSNASGIS